MADLKIRRATEDDSEGIAEVTKEVNKSSEPVAIAAMNAEQVTARLERLGEQGGMFLAEDAGKVVAFAILDFSTDDPETATFGAWVLPSHRKMGLGTQLAERCLELARDKGYRRIRGRLPQGNEVALSFLSSIGALVPLYNSEARFELPL
jgi:GNAT superfamily N-acetyltransferase